MEAIKDLNLERQAMISEHKAVEYLHLLQENAEVEFCSDPCPHNSHSSHSSLPRPLSLHDT